MSKKTIPYIFLSLLILLLIFIGGVKYGQRVERTNKVISYLLSITPSPRPDTPTPVSSKPAPLNTIESCGISFVYPGTIKVEQNSRGAIVNEYQGETFHTIATISCSDAFINNFLLPDTRQDIDISTMAASLKQKRGSNFKIYKNKDGLRLKVIHPNGTFISMDFDEDLLPLIDASLQFVTPTPTKIPTLEKKTSPTASASATQ